jgi:hypothetical protein
MRKLILAGTLLAALALPTAASQARPMARGSSAAWCRASASYNRRYRDYDVYVHSNQPHRDARVKNSNGHELFGYPTNGEGYADIYVYAHGGQKVTVEVGRARCYTYLS